LAVSIHAHARGRNVQLELAETESECFNPRPRAWAKRPTSKRNQNKTRNPQLSRTRAKFAGFLSAKQFTDQY
jgi:hypothetical protein